MKIDSQDAAFVCAAGGIEESSLKLNRFLLYFSAQTEIGELGVSIQGIDSSMDNPSALRYRLELGRVESVLRKIEDWLDCSLDLVPQDVALCAPLVFSIPVDSGVGRVVSLHLPVDCWHTCPRTATDLVAGGVQPVWQDYYAKLFLGTLRLSDQELKTLSIGSTVLIPDSFSEQWHSSLVIPAANCSIAGSVNSHELSWMTNLASAYSVGAVAEQKQSEVADASILELRCFCVFSSKLLFSAIEDLEARVSQQFHHQGCVLQCEGEVRATGSLRQVGRGAGLQITRVSASTD